MRKRAEHITSNMIRALTQFYLEHHAKEVKMQLQTVDSSLKVWFQGQVNLEESEFEKLKESLTQPNTTDIEYYYSELLDSSDSADLMILGALIDRSELAFDNGLLTIDLWKHFNK